VAVRQVDVALVPLGTEVSYGEDGYEVKGFGSEIALTAEKKLEEKHSILSLELCKNECENHYQKLTEYIALSRKELA